MLAFYENRKNDLTLSELSYRRIACSAHLHHHIEVAVMLDGHAVAFADTEHETLESGDIFIAFPNQIHGYENSEQCRAVVFIIPVVPYLSAYRDTLEQRIPADPVLHAGQWEGCGVRALLDMALREAPVPDSPLMQGYILLIVGKLLPLLQLVAPPAEYPNALHPLLMYLNDHYTEPLTRKEVAAAVGYNESYISHLFSDTLHTTLTDYITSLRIEDAAHLLTTSSQSISQIAGSLGFGSIRSFNRAFLSRMHLSPSAYRTACATKTAPPPSIQ